MTQPQPALTPSPTPPGHQRPQVRLEVRVGSSNPVRHTLTGGEFLIGGVAGCNLVLSGANLPHLVCQIAVSPEGVRLRRLAETFPVLVNGEAIPEIEPVPLHTGDRIAVGSADIAVTLLERTYLKPSFVPFTPPPPPASSSAQTPPPSTDTAALEAVKAEWRKLDHARAKLAEETAELEADRVLWYRRRTEIEDECRRLKDQASGPAAAVTDREIAAAAREAELDRARVELETLRSRLATEFTDQRNAVSRERDVLASATAELHARQQQLDHDARHLEPRLTELRLRQDQLTAGFAELDATRASLTAERQDLARERNQLAGERQAFETERAERERSFLARDEELTLREEGLLADRKQLTEDRDRYAADLLRLDRWQGVLDDRKQYLDQYASEIDLRAAQVRRDTAELEEQVALADADQERLQAESERLELLRSELDGRAVRLSEQSSQIETQQAALAVFRAKLDRQHDDLRDEAARLAADRARFEESRTELDTRLREAESLRAELSLVRDGHAEQQRSLGERTTLLETTLREIHDQQDHLAVEDARLKQKEAELDQRSAEIAEQAAALKSRLTQSLDLQQRLEADRAAVRHREETLTEAEMARVAFQDQLRRRAEELAARSKDLDEAAGKIAEERAALDRHRTELQHERDRVEQTVLTLRSELAGRSGELERQTAALAEREATLARQVDRLRETGRNVAEGRKQLAEARRQWDADRAAAADRDRKTREDLHTFHSATGDQIDRLRSEAKALEDQTGTAFERLAAARDLLRGQLAELHAYAAQTRSELDETRATLRADTDRVRDREQALDRARDEHRLAVAQFRQQLLEWQSRVGELKEMMARTETRVETRSTEVNEAAARLDATTIELARQAEELRREREQVSERRAEVERHLSDMREWYRKKLRELAKKNESETSEPALRIAPVSADDLEPGDRQLGDLLRRLELIDGDTLTSFWCEANRQHRTLRQVLLASGAITIYQLALIEAGNLDALMLGRFRVVDRLRVTPRETIYRVFDPMRADSPSRGTYLLRHLSEAEAQDATHPDEFRQRFAAARDAAHPNLAATLEVLDIQGRPAALQEWLTGAPSLEWPATAAVPGVWLRLVTNAASGLMAGHHAGLVHGRLTSNSFVLTDDGGLKLLGLADPSWLVGISEPALEPTPMMDLRVFGQIIFGWSQLGQTPGKKRNRAKGLPEPLVTVIRRLEAESDTPMADTAAGIEPYRSGDELLDDLNRLTTAYPCRNADWNTLLAEVAGRNDDEPVRQSA